jgi:hypothetical protein
MARSKRLIVDRFLIRGTSGSGLRERNEEGRALYRAGK